MAVILINPFIVPADKEEEFLRNWNETSQHFSKTPGFIETHMHKNVGVGNGTFTFINYAKWESAEAWSKSHGDYQPGEYKIPGVKGHAAIYEIIIDLVRDEKKA